MRPAHTMLFVGQVACMALAGQAAPVRAPARSKPAVIGASSGDVRLVGAVPRAIRAREWLAEGAVLELPADARVVVVYRSGRRFEVRGATVAKIGPEALASAGRVEELERLPPWPAFPSLDPKDARGTHEAAARVRTGFVRGMQPAEGGAVPAGEAWLQFEPEAGASLYAVDVRDESGAAVYQVRTRSVDVLVPPELLQPGRQYVWSVATVDNVGLPAKGEAGFRTLAASVAAARREIHAAAERIGSADARAYVEELDSALGLSLPSRGDPRLSAN